MQYVYVLNKHGEPLMPCSPGKARLLLKQQKAHVIKRTPFTIKLLYGSTGYKQPITLGVDAGSKHVGLSASTEKRELYREEFTPRNDVVDLLSTRKQNRRSRRNRKTRYRPPRFDNRVHSKHKGWLAPSVEVKIQEHITVIKRICRILPITLVRVETAEFDTQRLKAMLAGKPIPVGTDYQLGEMYDKYNVRQYVLKRDNYTPANVVVLIPPQRRLSSYMYITLKAVRWVVMRQVILLLCVSLAMMHFTREKYPLIIRSAASRCAMLLLWALCAEP